MFLIIEVHAQCYIIPCRWTFRKTSLRQLIQLYLFKPNAKYSTAAAYLWKWPYALFCTGYRNQLKRHCATWIPHVSHPLAAIDRLFFIWITFLWIVRIWIKTFRFWVKRTFCVYVYFSFLRTFFRLILVQKFNPPTLRIGKRMHIVLLKKSFFSPHQLFFQAWGKTAEKTE